MEEITFRNKREDLDAYYDYMLNTEEGKQIGRKVYIARSWLSVLLVALLFTLLWGVRGYLGASIRSSLFLALGFIFVLIVAEIFVMAIMGFKPYYFVGKQVLKKSEKSLTKKDLQIFELPRTVKISDDWLEVRNSEAVHQ